MRAVAQAAAAWVRQRYPLAGRPVSEPEPVYAPQPRAITGFFASLSPEQRAYILAYKGEENHGDLEFKVVSPPVCV